MDSEKIAGFIRKQQVAFICSVDEEGFSECKSHAQAEKNGRDTQILFLDQHLINEGKTIYE